MTTSTDIANLALQLIGTRTTIVSLGEGSNEAIQANLVYQKILNWCFGLTNWNFARVTATLTALKNINNPLTPPWTNALPALPWIWSYALPADFIRAIYLTNSDGNGQTPPNYVGEPKRFVIASDVVSAVQTSVLLTNQNPAILIYTSNATQPTQWPALFERTVVAALAWTLSRTLTGDKEVVASLKEIFIEDFSIAEQWNRGEGLILADSTPEWIQAVGIDYPFQRRVQSKERGNANR